mmetsp:Transcript_23623/g.79370  ORF Transcript_23623/g.79370 Transcript_23623/m.79370 type:complete len:234 (+) Transcript_23623:764-1465(+)
MAPRRPARAPRRRSFSARCATTRRPSPRTPRASCPRETRPLTRRTCGWRTWTRRRCSATPRSSVTSATRRTPPCTSGRAPSPCAARTPHAGTFSRWGRFHGCSPRRTRHASARACASPPAPWTSRATGLGGTIGSGAPGARCGRRRMAAATTCGARGAPSTFAGRALSAWTRATRRSTTAPRWTRKRATRTSTSARAAAAAGDGGVEPRSSCAHGGGTGHGGEQRRASARTAP